MTRRGPLGAELALAGLTMAVALGTGRLFEGGDWLVPLAVNCVLAHLFVAVLRRRGAGLAVSALAALAATGVVAAASARPGSTLLGLPTPTTLELLDADLSAAWTAFGEVVAPAPVLPGFVFATAVTVWFIAFVADWAAFRLWASFEATLPAATLFVFTALLGTDRGRGWSTALFAAAGLAFLLVHRVTRQGRAARWAATDPARGRRYLLGAGAALALTAVVAGVNVGPALPGASSAPLLDTRRLTDDDRRVTISPLVDIRSRLVDQPDVVVFTVEATRRAYWRITSLDEFDGRAWTSSGTFGRAEGELPTRIDSGSATDVVRQRFTIQALSAIWLPAAYEPRGIEVADGEARYDAKSATLIVDSSRDTSNQLVYDVVSAVPRPTPDELRAAPDEPDLDDLGRYLALPDDFSERVRAEAERVTAGATTTYDRALALQQHLRTFTYDIDVERGHGIDDIEQFLFTSRRGYCEQFAGAFAAMARAVGLPARVAVGFTPGRVDPARPDDPEVDDEVVGYVVRGENAHAWPEVYLEGHGWVLFEPTPGRGAPFAQDHTGVPEAQAAPGDPTATSTPPTTDAAQPVDPAAPVLPESDLAVEDPLADLGVGGVLTPTAPDGPDLGERTWFALRWFVLLPAGTAVLYGLVLVLLHRRRHRARRHDEPVDRVRGAWAASLDSLAVLGVDGAPHETHAEVAARVARRVPDAAAPMGRLADLASSASWSTVEPDPAEVDSAEEAHRAVATLVRSRTSVLDRVRHAVRTEQIVAPRPARHHVEVEAGADTEAEGSSLDRPLP